MGDGWGFEGVRGWGVGGGWGFEGVRRVSSPRAFEVGPGDPEPLAGEVDAAVAEEFPELRLWTLDVAGAGFLEGSPDGVRQQLSDLSDKVRGAQAVALRTKPIPHAYRVFFRHIGLDPDEHRIPVEELVVERLKAGGFRPESRIYDAITVAVMETQVPVWAIDRARVDGPMRVGLDGGRLAMFGGSNYLSALFAPVRPEFLVHPETTEVTLFSLTVPGVPALHVEEAFWLVVEALSV